jgi:hypothetical protein
MNDLSQFFVGEFSKGSSFPSLQAHHDNSSETADLRVIVTTDGCLSSCDLLLVHQTMAGTDSLAWHCPNLGTRRTEIAHRAVPKFFATLPSHHRHSTTLSGALRSSKTSWRNTAKAGLGEMELSS